jgi:hypothetical protein
MHSLLSHPQSMHSQNAVNAQSAESFTVTENSALFYYILDSYEQSFLPWCTVQYFQGSELHSLTELLEISMVILYYSIVFSFYSILHCLCACHSFLKASMTPSCELTISTGVCHCDKSCASQDLIM